MNQILSLTQAAELIGAEKSAVARWLRNGKLPGTQMPGPRGQWVVYRADVEAYIVAHADDPHHRTTPARDGYLSVTEAAKVLGLSRQAMYDRRRAGKLQMAFIDGRWYVPVSELGGN